MTKIIISIILFLSILLLYFKNKKIKKIIQIMCLICLFSFCFEFKTKLITNEKISYLYTASDFNKYVSYAQKSMEDYGVYASLTLAQAALEQGLVPTKSNSLFGIKASKGWTGKKFSSVTEEQDKNGNSSVTVGSFRGYSSVADSFDNHGYFLVNEFGNRGEFNSATTLESQLIALKSNSRAMYATDKDYVCKLVNIINKYDLTKYDVGITYSGRGITITGTHISSLSISNCSNLSYSNNSSSSSSSSDIIINYNTSTSYTGNLKNGYIFKRLNTKENEDLLEEKLNAGEIDNIISTIYNRIVIGLNYNGSGKITDYSITEMGSVDAGPYSSWRQSDSKWGSIRIGSTSKTISGIGCLVTSISIQMARSGVSYSNELGNLNPGTLTLFLNQNSGFDGSGSLYWNKVTLAASNFKFGKRVKVNSNNLLSTISSYLSAGYYPVIHVNGSIRNNTHNHWVAVTGVTNSDVYIIDPASSYTLLSQAYGLKYVDTVAYYYVG